MSGLVYESSVRGLPGGGYIARVWRERGRTRFFERVFQGGEDDYEDARTWAYNVGWKGKKADRA